MKKIILFAAAALALASCENNDDNTVPCPQQARITATIGESTRAKDDTWNPGDKIGISSTVGPEVGPYINLEYTTDGNGEFIGSPLFYYKPMTLIAYYPFKGPENTAPGLIEAKTSAEYQKAENQPTIDFLWDTKTNKDQADFSATDPTVKFEFSHKMSKLTFALEGSKEEVEVNGVVTIHEVKAEDIVRYEIEGLVLDGTFDPATGVCSIDNSVDPQNIEIKIKDFIEEPVKEGESLSPPPLIVFPQKPGNSKVILHVYTDELKNSSVLQHYTCALTFKDGELEPGNNYKFTIRVSKVGLKLAEMKIVDWNTEREVNLTATIDGNVTEGGATEDEQK